MTILYSDLDVSRITSTELEDNERSQGQKIAYPRYDHPTLGADQALIVQFPWIKLSSYGIPRAGKYYKTDSDRAFVKLPLDASIPETSKLIDTIKKIDALFSSPEFGEKLLGKKWNKYKYTPIFREPNEPEEEEDKPKNKIENLKPRLPYMKLKIATDYNTGNITTILFKSELIDGKRQRSKVDDIKTIDEFAGKVSYLSNFRPIVRCVKFWAQPLTKKDPQWGAIFKIIKAEVEPTAKNNNMYKDFMNSDAFLDSDEEKEKTVVTTKKAVANVESDDDSDDDKPVAKGKPVVKKIVSDDDEDSEEDKHVVKGKQMTKKVESDDDDSEEDKPVVKGKQMTKKVESDDDSEEDKPAPKATKPAPKATRGGKGGKAVHA